MMAAVRMTWSRHCEMVLQRGSFLGLPMQSGNLPLGAGQKAFQTLKDACVKPCSRECAAHWLIGRNENAPPGHAGERGRYRPAAWRGVGISLIARKTAVHQAECDLRAEIYK